MSKAILDTAEVIHDYMRNGDRSTSREECITWIARLIQEVSQQSPSATVNSKFTINDDYEVIDEDGINRTQYARSHKELRESLAKLSDVIDKSQQAPSATVDLPAIKTLFAKWCNAKTEDTHSNAMTLNAFAVAVAELLHSQRPSVDDPYMKNFGVSSQQPTVDVDAEKLFYKYAMDSEDKPFAMTFEMFEKALTEALRGSYSREDMIAFGMDCCSNWDDNGIIDAKLDQYDTERGNGK